MRPHFKPLIWDVYARLPDAILQPIVRYRHGHIWTIKSDPETPVLVHIPKTGGSSVAQELYGQTINHYPVSIWQMADPDQFRDTRVFAILREPTERLISAIRHCISGPRASSKDLRLGRYLNSLAPDTLGILDAYLESASLRKICSSNIMFKPYDFWLGKPGEVGGLQVFKLDGTNSAQPMPGRRNVNLAENGVPILSEHIMEKAQDILRKDHDWYDLPGLASVSDATEAIAALAKVDN